mgnify:FL=1
MIKTIAKVFAFTSIFKNLVLTQKSKTEGITQLHPIKIPGRTVFVREKEYFIRENIVEGTIPIVFLHSWGTDSLGSWFNVLPKIKNVSSFITIDFKNHGRSDASWERWSVDENADIVISILDELNVSECHLVGWSMGSAVALTISKKIPERINKMVLVTPFSWIEGERYKDNFLFKLLVGAVRIRERLFPNKNPQSKYSFLKKSSALKNEFTDWAWNNLHRSKDDFIYGDGGRHVVAFDSRDWLGDIETETLALIGGKDSLVPQKASQEVTTKMQNITPITFTNALHGIPWTHDEELVEELTKFLNL